MFIRKSTKDYLKANVKDISKLLTLALDQTKEQLFSNPGYELNDIEHKTLNNLIKQRTNGKPFAYLKGSQGFYDLDFVVSPATLIPRPETELLIDIALDTFDTNKKISALDLGTGSGIIAITLSEKRPKWKISATDLSIDALNIAKLNSTEDIDFYCGSWFVPLPLSKFDLIVSNPPYINEHDPHLEDLKYEPIVALVSGDDGLDLTAAMLAEAAGWLSEQGLIVIEVGNSELALQQAFPEIPFMWLELSQGGNGIFCLTGAQCRQYQAQFYTWHQSR